MKLEDKIIYGVEYTLNVIDDGTDIVLQESYWAPDKMKGISFHTIKLDFIPATEVKDSFAPENRWY